MTGDEEAPMSLAETSREGESGTGAVGAATVRVEVITSPFGLEALRTAWNALVDLAPGASIFVTWEWQFLWWKHYGADRQLRVLAAFAGDRLVGILPLYQRKRYLLRCIPLCVLQPLGIGGDTSPDYLEPLVAAESGSLVPTSLIRHVIERLHDWDEFSLSDIDPASKFRPVLEKTCREHGIWIESGVSARIRYIVLPASWDEFIGSLSRDRRQAMRYLRRRFEAIQGARFRVVSEEGPGLDIAIDRLIELHRIRWSDRGARYAFSSLEYCGFHRELMHALQRKGNLRLIALEVETTVIAMLYCYRFRDAWLYFQAGFDPAFGKLSPGLVLLGYAIESAIAEGCREFDMLRGEHEYKAQLAKLTRESFEIRVTRPGMRTAAQRTRERLAALRRAK